MKIDFTGAYSSSGVSVPTNPITLTKTASSSNGSQLSREPASGRTAISHVAQLALSAMALPDIDSARVSTIQAAISNGTIQVESGKIASSLMQYMLTSSMGLKS